MAFETVARLSDLPVGSLRLARVDGHRLCVVRTGDGVFALDNACPHEGYGLTTGDLDGDELTCEWHNWRFRVSDGRCTLGEEDVVSHEVRVDGDEVRVRLTRPDPRTLRAGLTASLRRGIDNGYVGQISRDVVRLLRADEDPAQLVWEAVAWGAPRAEFGFGHTLASATDCLALVDRHEGDHRALPVVQAIAGIAEVERRRPVRPGARAGPRPPRPTRPGVPGVGGAGLGPGRRGRGVAPRCDRGRARPGRAAALAGRRRRRPPPRLRPRSDLPPEGVRAGRPPRVGTRTDGAAAPRHRPPRHDP